MRPVPPPKHMLSATIFMLVAACYGYLAWHDHALTGQQCGFATAAAKRHQPELLTADSVYGEVYAEGQLRQIHTPVFLAMMDLVLIPTQYRDPELPFRLLTGPLVFVYLCGMYALLWQLCRSSSIAAFVAILSTTVTATLGPWRWGIGPIGMTSPQGIVYALAPLILLSYLRNAERPQAVLTFAAVGLCANVDLLSSANLALVLFLVHITRNRFGLGGLVSGLIGLCCFVLGALPYTLYFLVLRGQLAPSGGGLPAPAVVWEALQLGNATEMYPEILKSLLAWAPYAGLLLLISILLLWRFERFRTRGVDSWLWMVAWGLVVSLGLHGLMQAVGAMTDRGPPIIAFSQASTWTMLGLYILFAQALTLLFRILRKHRRALRWVCALFMIAWMLPSMNLRPARWMVYRWANQQFDTLQEPTPLDEVIEEMDSGRELRSMARWARTHTPEESVFLVDSAQFRMLSCRSLYACRSDIRPVYYLTPWLLEDWTHRCQEQLKWLSPPIDVERLSEAIDAMAREPVYQQVGAWYLVLPAAWAPQETGRLTEIPSPGWGRYWRLYSLEPRGGDSLARGQAMTLRWTETVPPNTSGL